MIMGITRNDAKVLGLKRYLGSPCKYGHHEGRRVSTCNCVVCQTNAIRDWAERNPEKIRGYGKSSRSRHRDKRNLAKRKWYAENKEHAREYAKRYELQNLDERRAYRAQHKVDNRHYYTAIEGKRRAAKLRRTPDWLTRRHLKQIEAFYLTCPTGWHVDHIVPLQGKTVSGLHVPWNLQHLPSNENSSKGNIHA